MSSSFISYIRQGLEDVRSTLGIKQIWVNLALFEVKARYKRTKLGPWWITISTLVMLIAMGPLYAKLFHKEVGSYYLYIAGGFIFWNYMTTNITECAKSLHDSSGMILSYGYPISMYITKIMLRNIIVMAHNMLIIIIFIVIFSDSFGPNALGFIAGFALTALNMFFVGIMVALISCRFRDIEQIIGSVITVLFFLTPIFWDASAAGEYQPYLYLNPMYSLLDIMRAPLISNQLPYLSFLAAFGMLFITVPLSLYLLGKLRHRVALWL